MNVKIYAEFLQGGRDIEVQTVTMDILLHIDLDRW